jgi:hypothetical protein
MLTRERILALFSELDDELCQADIRLLILLQHKLERVTTFNDPQRFETLDLSRPIV